jgi:hypothetical protein
MNKSYSKIRHIQESNQRLERRLLMEQSSPQLTLDNINSSLNKIIYGDITYRGYIGGTNLKGVIVMTSEFSEINKRNNWNRPERIDTDFSKAKPLTVTQELQDVAKSNNITVDTNVKNDYEKIYFTYISQATALFGDKINEGKVKQQSVLIRCKSGSEILFIFQSAIDGNWYYVNTVG